AGGRGAADADGAHMSRGSFVSVALAVAWRKLPNWVTKPALVLPGPPFPRVLLHGGRRGPFADRVGAGVQLHARLHHLRLRVRPAPGGHLRGSVQLVLDSAGLRV